MVTCASSWASSGSDEILDQHHSREPSERHCKEAFTCTSLHQPDRPLTTNILIHRLVPRPPAAPQTRPKHAPQRHNLPAPRGRHLPPRDPQPPHPPQRRPRVRLPPPRPQIPARPPRRRPRRLPGPLRPGHAPLLPAPGPRPAPRLRRQPAQETQPHPHVLLDPDVGGQREERGDEPDVLGGVGGVRVE